MSEYTILISESEGGLAAVAEQSGCTLVAGTANKFSTLTTRQDVPMSDAGVVRTEKPGWVALGKF